MDRIVTERAPSVLVLNVGAVGPIRCADFRFNLFANWFVDVEAGFYGYQAVFEGLMQSGSCVLIMSSGAALMLSSPHLGARRMLRVMARANALAHERGLKIRVQILAPRQLMARTALAREVASAYAALDGLTAEDDLSQRYGTPLQPQGSGERLADVL